MFILSVMKMRMTRHRTVPQRRLGGSTNAPKRSAGRAERLECQTGAALPSRGRSPSGEKQPKQRERGGARLPHPLNPPWALIYCPAPGCCCGGQGLIVPQWGLFLIEQPEIWELTHPNGCTILSSPPPPPPTAAALNEACRPLPAKVPSALSGHARLPGRRRSSPCDTDAET